jgi:hypothetical protein
MPLLEAAAFHEKRTVYHGKGAGCHINFLPKTNKLKRAVYRVIEYLKQLNAARLRAQCIFTGCLGKR